MNGKIWMGIIFVAGGLMTSGCLPDPQAERVEAQRRREDMLMFEEDIRRMKSRLEELERQMDMMNADLQRVSTDQNQVMQSQMKGINATLDDLNRRIQTVDQARIQDRKEIVESLSGKIAGMMTRAAPATTRSSRPISSEGYEHTVQPGETLSAIASAYNARSSDIIQANNLQNPNVLQVGQVLFIPAP